MCLLRRSIRFTWSGVKPHVSIKGEALGFGESRGRDIMPVRCAGGTHAQDRNSWRVLVILFFGEVMYLSLTLAALALYGDLDESKFRSAGQRWPRQGDPVFWSHLTTWDGAHYLYLSEVGYGSGVPSCAFYPLWPMAMRGVALATGLSHPLVGMILANVFSVLSFWIFFRVMRRRFGERTTRWSLAFLWFFPGGVFYRFVYTEPMFFLLVMMLVEGLDTGRRWMIGVAAFLLPMARAVGVFAVMPMSWAIWCRHRFVAQVN
jgi:hypothetical protein